MLADIVKELHDYVGRIRRVENHCQHTFDMHGSFTSVKKGGMIEIIYHADDYISMYKGTSLVEDFFVADDVMDIVMGVGGIAQEKADGKYKVEPLRWGPYYTLSIRATVSGQQLLQEEEALERIFGPLTAYRDIPTLDGISTRYVLPLTER